MSQGRDIFIGKWPKKLYNVNFVTFDLRDVESGLKLGIFSLKSEILNCIGSQICQDQKVNKIHNFLRYDYEKNKF